MKFSLLAAAAFAAVANAHYIFNILVVNGKTIGGEYEYARRNRNSYNPVFPDVFNKKDLRCNEGAKGGTTKTYTVKAGDKLGFRVFNRETIEHPGPAFIYLSRAPDGTKLNDWEGDGKTWFKAWESGLCKGQGNVDSNWCTWQKTQIDWTVPAKVPPGDYLVRVEHIGLHEGHRNRAQLYMECFQLRIEGPGGGTPGPLVEIPGIYKANDPGIAYDKWSSRPAPYVMPGPAVWDGN